jgi:hypothetical protein
VVGHQQGYPSAVLDLCQRAQPNDVFRVILCHWGMLCHHAQNVWWCEGVEQLLSNSFRERMMANPTLRQGEFFDAMKVVATLTDNQEPWFKFG